MDPILSPENLLKTGFAQKDLPSGFLAVVYGPENEIAAVTFLRKMAQLCQKAILLQV